MLADVAGVLAGGGQTWFVLAECSCPVELYSDTPFRECLASAGKGWPPFELANSVR